MKKDFKKRIGRNDLKKLGKNKIVMCQFRNY